MKFKSLLISILFFVTACASVSPVIPQASVPREAILHERLPSSDFQIPMAVVTRAKQLSRVKDVATGHGFRSREALGAARLERHLQGRKLSGGESAAVDWVDAKLGKISLKGPLVDDANYDGIPEALQGLNIEAVKNAIRRDLQENPAAPTLVIDTLGLTEGEVTGLQEETVKAANPFKKSVFILLVKEMKTLKPGSAPPAFDRFETP